MTQHYYILEGESLDALNRLIEFDTLMNDFNMGDFKKKLAAIMGAKAPEEDPLALQQKLSTHFTSAQRRAYKEKLGFTAPPVQVYRYGENILHRAYHVFPKIVMNPGTSPWAGLGNLLQPESAAEKKRIAIYTAHEDYKGCHFAPPGAVKISKEEFDACIADDKDSFTSYSSYNEGTAMPADFDPARHQTISTATDRFQFSHAFLATGKTREDMIAYRKAKNGWHMPYQSFRDDDMRPILRYLTPYADRLSSWIEDPKEPGKKRAVSFKLTLDDWNLVKDGLTAAFDVQEIRPRPLDNCEALLVPRTDTPLGAEIAAAMAKVPPYPVMPVDFGFEKRPPLQDCMEYSETVTGFPYMRIERYEGGDVKLLAFRLPPNVRTITPPEGCTPISIDDYNAIAGAERDISKERTPGHVFRIGGETWNLLHEYDTAMKDYKTRDNALRDGIVALLQSAAPGCTIDEYRFREYDTGTPRNIGFLIKKDDYLAAKNLLQERFTFREPAYFSAHNRYHLDLVPRQDTEAGKEMAQSFKNVPYEPSFGSKLYSIFGFVTRQGYDLMDIQILDNTEQAAILYFLPDYINGVEAPDGTVALTKEEYACLFADSCDLYDGAPLPPRPAHLKHLPAYDNSDVCTRIENMKKARAREGLPLYNR